MLPWEMKQIVGHRMTFDGFTSILLKGQTKELK